MLKLFYKIEQNWDWAFPSLILAGELEDGGDTVEMAFHIPVFDTTAVAATNAAATACPAGAGV